MRASYLLPLLLVLGMGCVVRDPVYTSAYVGVGYAEPAYPVYASDGYYWSYYNDGWYWWSSDRWVYSYSRPRSPVRIRLSNAPGGGYHQPSGRAWRGGVVRDHRTGAGRRSAPTFRTPPPRSAPPPSAHTRVRDHRR